MIKSAGYSGSAPSPCLDSRVQMRTRERQSMKSQESEHSVISPDDGRDTGKRCIFLINAYV